MHAVRHTCFGADRQKPATGLGVLDRRADLLHSRQYVPDVAHAHLVSNQEDTIVGGAIELMHHHAYGIAAIILIASVLIPVGKFMAVAFLALEQRA